MPDAAEDQDTRTHLFPDAPVKQLVDSDLQSTQFQVAETIEQIHSAQGLPSPDILQQQVSN